MTLPEYDERIRGYAKELGVVNPAAFGTGYPALVAAIAQVKFPTVEVHISNPIRRGPASQTAAVSQSVVAGFGIGGYALALRGIRDMSAAKK
jgi:3-dehydroquinate dehydratase-2